MQYRKLISFGSSTYVISLPKSWIVRKGLKKGDLIHIDETQHDLVLTTEQDREKKEKEVTLGIDGKSIRRIQREIITSYINDNKTIILAGKDLKDKAKQIQETIHNLMALEVMEQTSTKIVARDFLDMSTISIFNLIRKIDLILRAMLEDCEKMFTEDNYENIYHRDNDVNRLSFLIFRAVKFGLDNSFSVASKRKLKSADLLAIWLFTSYLESIGDDIKRTARYMRTTELDEKQRQILLHMLFEIKQGYLSVLKGFHNSQVNLVYDVLETKEMMLQEGERFYNQNKKIENIGLLIGTLRSMVTNIHSLGRVIYQNELTSE